jgi:hypothetical protein
VSIFSSSKDFRYDPEITLELSDLNGPATSILFEYWLTKKGARNAPQWDDFEFMDLYMAAPVMAVMDVDPSLDARKLRYRFVGTKIVEYRRFRKYPDLTGKTFEDGDRSYDPKAMLEAYNACIRTAKPILMRGEYQTDQSMGTHERIILPWLIGENVARLTNALDRFPVAVTVP